MYNDPEWTVLNELKFLNIRNGWIRNAKCYCSSKATTIVDCWQHLEAVNFLSWSFEAFTLRLEVNARSEKLSLRPDNDNDWNKWLRDMDLLVNTQPWNISANFQSLFTLCSSMNIWQQSCLCNNEYYSET